MRAMSDKAYSSKAIRKCLRDRGFQCVIPERMIRKLIASAKGQSVGGQCPTTRRRISVAMSWSAAAIHWSSGGRWPPAMTSSRSRIGHQLSCML